MGGVGGGGGGGGQRYQEKQLPSSHWIQSRIIIDYPPWDDVRAPIRQEGHWYAN